MKYFFQYIFVKFFYIFFRVLGLKVSSFIAGKIFRYCGLFSSRTKVALSNLENSIKKISVDEKSRILKNMWENFGRVLGEYPNLDKIKIKNNKKIKIINLNNLLEPLKKNKNCLFFSAHIGNW